MTPERVELVARLMGPYGNFPEYRPAMELVEHVRDLQAFVLDMAAHMDSPPSPDKTAEHYQLRARLKALREQIAPQGGQR
jgi:hypothetical protein